MLQKLKSVIPTYVGIQLKTSIKWIPAFAGMTLVILILTLFSSPVYAQTPAPARTSANTAAGPQQIEDVFTNVISVVVGLGFIVLLVMLIWAGFKYLTSGGEPKAVQAAHQAATWALLGILFMAIAWLVLRLIKEFTGIDVTKFKVGLPP